METIRGREEIINYIMNSTDADVRMIAAFITGMQIKNNLSSCGDAAESEPGCTDGERSES